MDNINIYEVNFVQNNVYVVKAENEDEAFDIAYKEFIQDMRKPVAQTEYDDVEVKLKKE